MKKYEVDAMFIGNLTYEVEANSKEEAEKIFLEDIEAYPDELGGYTLTMENVSLLGDGNAFSLTELNISINSEFQEQDAEHWYGIETEEI